MTEHPQPPDEREELEHVQESVTWNPSVTRKLPRFVVELRCNPADCLRTYGSGVPHQHGGQTHTVTVSADHG